MKALKNAKSAGIILLGILTLFLSSCSNDSGNLALIPKDTGVISVIDIKAMVKKGKLEEISELNLYKTFKKELKNENKKLTKMIGSIMEDPKMTGIDFKSDAFIFYLNQGENAKYFSISIGLKNEGKFLKFIEEVMDKMEMDYSIESKNSFQYTIIGNEVAIGWDKGKAIILTAENLQSKERMDSELETLFNLKSSEQITSNKAFTDFYKNKKDLSVWVSSNSFLDNFIASQIIQEVDYDLSDNYFSLFLNFGDDNISFSTEFTPNEEIKKLMDEYDITNKSFNKELLNYFPEQSYAAMSMSMDPMAYSNLMKENKDYGQLKETFLSLTGIEPNDVFESFKGSALFSLFGFENTEYSYTSIGYGFNEDIAEMLDEKIQISQAGSLTLEDKELLNQGKTIKVNGYTEQFCMNIKNVLEEGGTIETAISNDRKVNWYQGGWIYGQEIETTREQFLPLMGMAMDINGSKFIQELIAKIPEDEITKNGDYYEFKFANKYPAYFAVSESVCYITNDKNGIEAFKNEGFASKSFASSSISSNVSSHSMYGYLDLNFEDYPKDIRNEMESGQSNQTMKVFNLWNDLTNSLEIKQNSSYSMEIKLNIKNNKSNSLNTIITTIDENYKDIL